MFDDVESLAFAGLYILTFTVINSGGAVGHVSRFVLLFLFFYRPAEHQQQINKPPKKSNINQFLIGKFAKETYARQGMDSLIPSTFSLIKFPLIKRSFVQKH